MRRSDNLKSVIFLGVGLALATASVPAEPTTDHQARPLGVVDSVVAPTEGTDFHLTGAEIRPLGSFSARGAWQLEQQPLDPASNGGVFRLNSGLAAKSTGTSCFCGADGAIFSDGFESGDTSAWSQVSL